MEYYVELNFKFDDLEKQEKLGYLFKELLQKEDVRDYQSFIQALKVSDLLLDINEQELLSKSSYIELFEGLESVNIKKKKITLITVCGTGVEPCIGDFFSFLVSMGGKPLSSIATADEEIITFKYTKSGIKFSHKNRWDEEEYATETDEKPTSERLSEEEFDLDNPDAMDPDALVGTWIVTSTSDYTVNDSDFAKLAYIAVPERIVIENIDNSLAIHYFDDSGNEYSAEGAFTLEDKLMRLTTTGLTDIGTKMKTIESEVKLFGNYLRAKYTVSDDVYVIWIAEKVS